MEASELNRVNPVLNIIGVNSLRLGDLKITYFSTKFLKSETMTIFEFKIGQITTCKFTTK